MRPTTKRTGQIKELVFDDNARRFKPPFSSYSPRCSSFLPGSSSPVFTNERLPRGRPPRPGRCYERNRPGYAVDARYVPSFFGLCRPESVQQRRLLAERAAQNAQNVEKAYGANSGDEMFT